MGIANFTFDLPDELIALRPVKPRRSARLLISDKFTIRDMIVADLPRILKPGDRLVINDTKVIPAHLHGIRHRDGIAGVAVSINLDRPISSDIWLALARPARRIRVGDVITFGVCLTAIVQERSGEFLTLKFTCGSEDFDSSLSKVGRVPLPPYITSKRPTDSKDLKDYQSHFAHHTGSAAAPTASLHFDEVLIRQLTQSGIQFSFVTLHVGAGTFLPIRTEDLSDHRMHAERGELSQKAANEINSSLSTGQQVIAVGTTALRLVETASFGGKVRPWSGETDLFIKPGHKFSSVTGLMTNFHLPNTTLLVLVAALIGEQRLREVYSHAVAHRYRFFSYGDSSLLLP